MFFDIRSDAANNMKEMIITIQGNFIIGGLILLALLTGCARLPDYAMPRAGVHVDDPATIQDAFAYRHLTRADFKATTLPPDRTMHATSINAHTCTRIRPCKDSRFTVSRARYGESLIYIGGIESITFEAIMIHDCSWWNPTMPAKNSAYVLQHEQIHFALVELTARRLTVNAHEMVKTFMAIHPTPEAARAEIGATIKEWIRSAMDESLAAHTAFDEDTSLFHSPKRQHWWMEKIESELSLFQENN